MAAATNQFPGFTEAQAQPAAPPPPPPPKPLAADRAYIGTLVAISSVLASRLLLLLSIIGSFVLAIRADGNTGIYILVIYSALTVLPLVYLDITAHQRGGK